MLNVVILEDNRVHRDKLKDIIENCIIREKLDMKISLVTQSPEETIKIVENTEENTLFFIDIDLKTDINGLKVGELLRNKYPNCFIVFVTTHSEMSFLTFEYKIEALDFIIKDNVALFKDRVCSCLSKAMERMLPLEDDEILTIDGEESIVNIKFKDILFIETTPASHKLRIHEKNRQIEFYGTLVELEKKLNEDFIRCHKGFIVNMKRIISVDKRDRIAKMDNGERCPISFRYLSQVINRIQR